MGRAGWAVWALLVAGTLTVGVSNWNLEPRPVPPPEVCAAAVAEGEAELAELRRRRDAGRMGSIEFLNAEDMVHMRLAPCRR